MKKRLRKEGNMLGLAINNNQAKSLLRDQLDRCRWMERTQGSATRQISR
jgi:stalled ribosome alternative rescue factor ArfA